MYSIDLRRMHLKDKSTKLEMAVVIRSLMCKKRIVVSLFDFAFQKKMSQCFVIIFKPLPSQSFVYPLTACWNLVLAVVFVCFIFILKEILNWNLYTDIRETALTSASKTCTGLWPSPLVRLFLWSNSLKN